MQALIQSSSYCYPILNKTRMYVHTKFNTNLADTKLQQNTFVGSCIISSLYTGGERQRTSLHFEVGYEE
jgi:hypothetical protein